MIVSVVSSDLLELDEVEVQLSGLSGDPDGEYACIQCEDYICPHILVTYRDRDEDGIEDNFNLAIPIDEFSPIGQKKILESYKSRKKDGAGWESMVRGALNEAIEKGIGIEYVDEKSLTEKLEMKAVELADSDWRDAEIGYD